MSVRGGVYRRPAGFQVDLVCLSSWMDGEAPGSITALSVNSAYGLYKTVFSDQIDMNRGRNRKGMFVCFRRETGWRTAMMADLFWSISSRNRSC